MKCKNYEYNEAQLGYDGTDGFCENLSKRYDDFDFISGGFESDKVIIDENEIKESRKNCHLYCKNFKG